MKATGRLFFIILILSGIVFAQAPDVDISYLPQDQNPSLFELNITVSLTDALKEGLKVEGAEIMKLAPVKITVNDTSLWLKNNSDEPKEKNVIHWFAENDGLIFRFPFDDKSANDQIAIIFMPQPVFLIQDSLQIVIRNLNIDERRQVFPGEIVTSQLITKPVSE
ncbi:MAG: hypothetical protein JXR46_17115 [Calditrichaceae bacterium]|nr:hypothetical protein [Calditrichaceae bacterium]MBN2710769.1 hypothetical protein [Calditrichaceae bacterium]RQV94691.1 MAG: hypothetical protein EH224_09740 [Calditrichota bacterium]